MNLIMVFDMGLEKLNNVQHILYYLHKVEVIIAYLNELKNASLNKLLVHKEPQLEYWSHSSFHDLF